MIVVWFNPAQVTLPSRAPRIAAGYSPRFKNSRLGKSKVLGRDEELRPEQHRADDRNKPPRGGKRFI